MSPQLILAISRGLLYSPKARRQFIGALACADIFMVVLGVTWLETFLSEHPLSFLLYWILAAGLTLAMALLALFDLLKLRQDARKAKARLGSEFFKNEHDQNTG